MAEFAALPMLSAMFPEEPAAESMESAIFPAPLPDASPKIAAVKALKYAARVCSFSRMVLITWMTGVNALISPCPIVALSASNCRDRILT